MAPRQWKEALFTPVKILSHPGYIGCLEVLSQRMASRDVIVLPPRLQESPETSSRSLLTFALLLIGKSLYSRHPFRKKCKEKDFVALYLKWVICQGLRILQPSQIFALFGLHRIVSGLKCLAQFAHTSPAKFSASAKIKAEWRHFTWQLNQPEGRIEKGSMSLFGTSVWCFCSFFQLI